MLPGTIDVAPWRALVAVLSIVAAHIEKSGYKSMREAKGMSGSSEGETREDVAHIWACTACAVASATNGADIVVPGETNAVEKRGGHGKGERTAGMMVARVKTSRCWSLVANAKTANAYLTLFVEAWKTALCNRASSHLEKLQTRF